VLTYTVATVSERLAQDVELTHNYKMWRKL